MELHHLGWSAYFSQQCDSTNEFTCPGRVAWESRDHAKLLTRDGMIEARFAPSLSNDRPVTGDWVLFDVDTRVAHTRLERKSVIARKKAGREVAPQVLAANLDLLLIVTGLDGDFNSRRLDRYLIAAEEGGVRPVIVLNKADAIDARELDERAAGAARDGIDLIVCSALSGLGIDQLAAMLHSGETAALVGSSGVGKSTILNRLLGAGLAATQPVRESDSRGRHTTTHRSLLGLPNGALLIDTPGLREFEPWASAETVDAVFSDIEALASDCRFRDCLHRDEPGCAVRAAIEQGQLTQDRLDNFSKLRAEIEWLQREQNPLEAQKHKQWVKSVHRAMRHFDKSKRGIDD
jgi:ribosome biogenesis GTPase